LIWGIGTILVATSITPLLNNWFFEGRLSWEYFIITFIGALFTQTMIQSAEVMRLLYRPFAYITITLSQSILSAALILIFIISFDQGILGFFIGTAIASLVIAILGWFCIRDYWQFERIHINLWLQLIRFGLPLMPAGVAMYFMSAADRWFVIHFHGPESLGVFAIGAKFAMLLTLVIETFRKAWWPIAMDSMHSKDGPNTFRMIARLYMGIATAGTVVLTVISPWLVKWMTAPEFHKAWPIIGILAWHAVFYGFYLIASAGMWKVEKTYISLYFMSGAAIVGLLLNWLLVPTYGGVGAAIATSMTYFLWVIVSMYVSEKLWSINFPWMILFLQIMLGCIFVAWFTYDDNASNILISGSVAVLIVLIQFISAFQMSNMKYYLKFLKIGR
jgi:O-antigen/teichoic acid export membrane protein